MAALGEKVKFTAIIEKHPDIDGAYLRFPYVVQDLYGVKGQVKIRALFDDAVEYRGSLAKMGYECHLLGITKEIRAKLNKTYGDVVTVEIERDIEERVVAVPDEVMGLLAGSPVAREFYARLSYTNKKEYIRWIESAKKEETRTLRMRVFIEKLNHGKKFSDK